jgi:urea transport system substrate-binding protein
MFSSASPVNGFGIGLFVPSNGVAGIWGPSAIACATLAVEEINRAGGVLGREIFLRRYDASDESEDITATTSAAIELDGLNAIVGMHTSSVRQALIAGCQARVPFIYTALHEGGERSAGVYALGETPDRQLQPVIDLFVRQKSIRRWMFIGNDYAWPRVSHLLARGYVYAAGGSVINEHYVPFNTSHFDEILHHIAAHMPQALLLSLVGQDSVDFNRAFGHSGLGSKVLRLSCAVEENMLMAIGAENTENLFVSAGYFGALSDDANMSFKERYHQRFGHRAPTLNTLGQSTYEGIHFAVALAQQGKRGKSLMPYGSVRGIRWRSNADVQYPVHLARANGHLFQVLQSF